MPCWFRIGVNFHCWGDLRAAGSDGFGSSFYFDKAHSAVTSNFKAFMVAESRYFDVIFLGGLEDGEIAIDLVRFIVDEYLYLLGREGSIGSEHLFENSRTQQHQTDQNLYYTPPYHINPQHFSNIVSNQTLCTLKIESACVHVEKRKS